MNPSQIQEYYQRLELSPDASPDRIKQAYRKLALKWHPDVNGGSEESHLAMQALNEAYSTLSNPRSRRVYDNNLVMTWSIIAQSRGFQRDKPHDFSMDNTIDILSELLRKRPQTPKESYFNEPIFYKGKDGGEYSSFEALNDANKRYWDSMEFPKNKYSYYRSKKQ